MHTLKAGEGSCAGAIGRLREGRGPELESSVEVKDLSPYPAVQIGLLARGAPKSA